MIDGILYLDHNSTTPCDQRVLKAMLPYFDTEFWNAGSAHALGRKAKAAIEQARAIAASALGVSDDRLIFVSGATEGIQLVLERLPARMRAQVPFLASPVEHRAVRNSLERLRREGATVRFLSLDAKGIVASDQVFGSAVVVVQAANSETGVVQPIAHLAKVVHDYGGVLIVDGAQALWKLEVEDLGRCADALIISAHKAYGPKGIATVVLSEEMERILRSPGIDAQERGIREGTLNTPLIVGFAEAARLAKDEGLRWRTRAQRARDHFEEMIRTVASLQMRPLLTGSPRLPNTCALHVPGVAGDALVAACAEVALSYGTACSSGTPAPSPALLAFGIPWEVARQTVRVSFGRSNTPADAERAAQCIARTAQNLCQQRSSQCSNGAKSE